MTLAYVAWKAPTPRRYRLAGYVHRRTLAQNGGEGAPMHWHAEGDDRHLALYEVDR